MAYFSLFCLLLAAALAEVTLAKDTTEEQLARLEQILDMIEREKFLDVKDKESHLPVCELPKKIGPCHGYFPRWFYNSRTKACEPFTYGGCQGNDNNFATKIECVSVCDGEYPRETQSQLPVCEQPKKTGPCKASITRWFYNSITEACEQFIYGGCQGNDNNFETKNECESYCGEGASETQSQLPVCEQPKKTGPCKASIPRWFYNSRTEACEQFIYGGCPGNANNFKTKYACESYCDVEGASETQSQLSVCEQPKKTGPCEASIPRWFYNSRTDACELFIYGGCQANDNNFATENECERRCGGLDASESY